MNAEQMREAAAKVAELAPYHRGGIVCGCSEGLANWTAEAIRAIHIPTPAQVKVKPLVWVHMGMSQPQMKPKPPRRSSTPR